MTIEAPVVTVIILTRDEAVHLPRLFDSFKGVPVKFVVVDSGSRDDTVKHAENWGAEVYTHAFENYARQFNWALRNVPIRTPWTMRMDADEFLLPGLAKELSEVLKAAPPGVGGYMLRRRVYFWGRWIRHGGYYPTWLLRIWRTGQGHLESRAMDEHVILETGTLVPLKNDFVDENLKGLGAWTEKHNRYADREVQDLLRIRQVDDVPEGQAGRRRRMKLSVYAKLPLFLRAFLYWGFRYFFRLGFLDGRAGLVFHFLQGFWYRFLIDAKLYEFKQARANPDDCD